ncbi:MAG: copper resistance system multicopper oxidase [Sideroxydans sp.]|nr:copper resistance system multicopper oxidase [Sideroxydans sp.]
MKHRLSPAVAGTINLPRRQFVQGLAAGGVLAGLGMFSLPAWAAGATKELVGQEFDLAISELPVNFTGQSAMATAINGQVPGPLLRWCEGDTVTLRVTNRLKVPTSIHWHGIILPGAMDGVPGLSFDGIAPGETFVYRFKVGQSGTYWYHSHSGFQEQTGVYGPIVIEPRESSMRMREHVLMLSDWTDEDPERVYAKLKTFDGYYNYAKPTLGDLRQQAKQQGWDKAWSERMMWDQMRMSPRDLADVTGATYTFLANGNTPAGNWTALFDNGEKVKLRIINASAMTYFDLRIPGLKMTVVAADGQPVHPVTVDEFRIGVAETYDVVVEPDSDTAYTIFAQAMDRSGYARATLAPRIGMSAAVPALDPVPTLDMMDMGMEMQGAMAMSQGGMDMSQGTMNMPQQGAMNTAAQPAMAMHGMQQHDMAGMPGMAMGGMAMGSMPMEKKAPSWAMQVKRHPATENGPGTAMQASVVSTRLDDPGAGLRNNGRRVLTYADLHSLDGVINPQEPTRTIELHLTGNMSRYMWSFDGVKFSDAEPVRLTYGERVRIVLVNDTMMEHPIHLHGMWSELENPHGGMQVRKHTISVKPGHAVSYRVLADARGRWAYHCHLMYHMKAGMFREVEVA